MHFDISEEDDARVTGPNVPQILKCVQNKQVEVPSLGSPLKEVVIELLNSLAVKYNWKAEEPQSGEARQAQALADALQEVLYEHARDVGESARTVQVHPSNSQEDASEAQVCSKVDQTSFSLLTAGILTLIWLTTRKVLN